MKTATPAIKSQLQALSGAVATINPQSQVARYIAADLKGGETKHGYMMTVISNTIREAFKGNTRDIPEAIKMCAGKSVKARAYLAGFQAIAGMVKPLSYTGKFDSKDNAPLRNEVDALTHKAEYQFECAFLEIVTLAKVEAQGKAKAKAKTAPVVEAGAPVADAVEAVAPATQAVELDIGTTVDAVVQAIAAGLLSPEELVLIRAALAAQADTVMPVAPVALVA